MILSVSRRTDIPAFYSDWFFNRLKEGFALVRNPMNIHQVSKVTLSPEVIDCIFSLPSIRMIEDLSWTYLRKRVLSVLLRIYRRR